MTDMPVQFYSATWSENQDGVSKHCGLDSREDGSVGDSHGIRCEGPAAHLQLATASMCGIHASAATSSEFQIADADPAGAYTPPSARVSEQPAIGAR